MSRLESIMGSMSIMHWGIVLVIVMLVSTTLLTRYRLGQTQME